MPVQVAIPQMFKSRDQLYAGEKNIPFTRFVYRDKTTVNEFDTINESCYYLDYMWASVMTEVAIEEPLPRNMRPLALMFIA